MPDFQVVLPRREIILVGVELQCRGARDVVVVEEIVAFAEQDTIAAVDVADQRLRRVIGILRRRRGPEELRRGDHVDGLGVEGLTVEAGFGEHREVGRRRHHEAAHVIGTLRLEAGLLADVGNIGHGVGVLACQLIGLSEQGIDVSTGRERQRILGPRIGANTAFDTVVA